MKRKIHIEVLRILAALFVIFNHTGDLGFTLFANGKTEGATYLFALFLSVVCKVAVPIFFMISGALILGKDISLKDLWVKKILRIVIVLAVVSFAYYLFNIKSDLSAFSMEDYATTLYSSKTYAHLWYLYAYLAFLISVPFLRAMTKALPDKAYQYLLVIYLVFSIVPTLCSLLFGVSLNADLKPAWLMDQIVLYPLMGYYVENKWDFSGARTFEKIGVLFMGAVSLVFAMVLTHDDYTLSGRVNQYYHSFLILMPCISLYVCAKRIFQRVNPKKTVETIVCMLGSCTFGIYLIHLIVPLRSRISELLYGTLNLPTLLATLLYCLVIFIESFVFVFVCKKIPIIKKFL